MKRLELSIYYAVAYLAVVSCIIGCGEEEGEEPPTSQTLEEAFAEIDIESINLQEYFPLKAGNRWEYDILGDGVFARNRILELGEPEEIDLPANLIRGLPPDADIDQPFFVCDVTLTESVLPISPPIEPDHFTFSEWYAISCNRILYRGSIFITAWGEGVAFDIVLLEDEMILGKEVVTVPAGNFACIKIKRDNSCNHDVLPSDWTRYAPSDSLPMYEWYSKGVGMIKREYMGSLYLEPAGFRYIVISEVLTKYELE